MKVVDAARAAKSAAATVRRVPEQWSWRGPRPRTSPEWYLGRHARSDAAGLVIGGASRSGTTLTRVMIDSHPDIACGAETGLFLPVLAEGQLSRFYGVPRSLIRQWERDSSSHPEFAVRFLAAHAAREGKPAWAEKTPRNVLNLGWILDRFPNAAFCHVVRDGRAVVNSLRTHPRYRIRRGRRVPTGIVNDLGACIDQWIEEAGAGVAFESHPRVVRVRYEDLVRNPEAALTPVLDKLGLPWSPAMAHHHQAASASRDVYGLWQNPEAASPVTAASLTRWQRDLTADQVRCIEERAGHLLAALGYH